MWRFNVGVNAYPSIRPLASIGISINIIPVMVLQFILFRAIETSFGR